MKRNDDDDDGTIKKRESRRNKRITFLCVTELAAGFITTCRVT